MYNFNGCKLQMVLVPQSPLLHFQAEQAKKIEQSGVTLRASEVKPKLDCFLLNRLREITRKDVSELKKDEKYKDIFIGSTNNALNLKMQIKALGKTEAIGIDNKKYPIFYGNMDSKKEVKCEYKIDGIFGDIELIIICFNNKLRNLIEMNIEEFFIVTNFGTMQNKGFGGFHPKEKKLNKELSSREINQMGSQLQKHYNSNNCFYFCFQNNENAGKLNSGCYLFNKRDLLCQKMFDEINDFYGIMKSGYNRKFNSNGTHIKSFSRSFIYQYMHNKNIDNEKAWMKQNEIAPIIEDEHRKNYTTEVSNPRYIRALLGVGERISFLTESRNQKIVVKVEHISEKKENKLERVSSPIFFKIINNVVFIVAKEVPSEIYDQEFEFRSKIKHDNIRIKETGKTYKPKSGRIHTPTKDMFDIQEFLENYIEYYNGELRELVWKIRRNKKIEKVGV